MKQISYAATHIRRKLHSLIGGSVKIDQPVEQDAQGHIDSFNSQSVTGWIRIPDSDSPQNIDIFVNGTCVGRNIAADRLRPDVRDAGLGDGRCGFVAPVRVSLPTASQAIVSVHIAGQARAALTHQFAIEGAEPPPAAATPDGLDRSADPIPFENFVSGRYTCKVERLSAEEIAGWCVDRQDFDRPVEVEVLIDGQPIKRISNTQPRSDLKKAGLSHGIGGLRTSLPLRHLDTGRYLVDFRLPDGSISGASIDIVQDRSPAAFSILSEQQVGISVIVPIYNAAEDLRVCIARLAAYTPESIAILLIDDGSTDPEIDRILTEAARHGNMTVLRNDRNLGFTGTINRGLAETRPDDVVILNSDARVTPGWTEGLRAAARSAPRIATVTPLSDRAGAFSAPDIGNVNPLPDGVDELTYARALRRRSLGLYPVVPTGNGFCMYIRRSCLDELGEFDEAAFPRGYGEENDFCMRAMRAGWRNIIDDRTYVFHERSKSFGEAKTGLLEAGRAVIESRYPEYTHAIEVFRTSDLIALARHRARQARQDCIEEPVLPTRMLFVISSDTGGTPQTNRDLMGALSDSFDCWLLRCDRKTLELSRMIGGGERSVCRHVLKEPVSALLHTSPDYETIVADWLLRFDFDIVHIRHIGWHSLLLPRIARALNAKVVFSFHDFYTMSPTVNLVDDAKQFLGEHFVAGAEASRSHLWPPASQPLPSGEWLNFWRRRFEHELEGCDALVTTSRSAREQLLQHLPRLPAERFVVIPHGRDFSGFHRHRAPREPGSPVRILIPGNINEAKGSHIIRALTEHDTRGLLEFHILGNTNLPKSRNDPNIIRHGKYRRDTFAEMAAPIRPHVGAIFSIWDETYCHTLTEMWSVGLPVIVFDFPTVATRVRRSGAGWVLDHRDIPALYEEILRIADDPHGLSSAEAAVLAWQSGEGLGNTTRVMAASYVEVYRNVLRGTMNDAERRAGMRVAVVTSTRDGLEPADFSASTRLWDRTRNRLDRDLTFIRMSTDTLLANLRIGGIDAAILQGSAVPLDRASEVLDAFAEARIPYVVDADDRVFTDWMTGGSGDADSHPDPAAHRLIATAAKVTASTPRRSASLRAINPHVALVPNALNDRLWRGAPAGRQPDGLVHALYLGSGPDGGLAGILPALDAVAADHPDFRLTVIDPFSKAYAIPERSRWLRQAVPPSDRQTYDAYPSWLRTLAADFDFAVAPIVTGSPAEDHAELRLLHYAALGLPVLASDDDAHHEATRHQDGATLVPNDTASWVDALRQRLAMVRTGTGQRTRKTAPDAVMIDTAHPTIDGLVAAIIEDSRAPAPAPSERMRVDAR